MANRYAVASGNWSGLATWDGGVTLPGAGDDVRSNGYMVTIDQDIVVTTLANNASSPAVAGGAFVVASVVGTRNISVATGLGGGYIGASNSLLRVSATSGIIDLGNTVIRGGTIGDSYGLSSTSTATIKCGSVYDGGGRKNYGMYITGNSSIIINGNVVSSAIGVNDSASIYSLAAPTITVNGSIIVNHSSGQPYHCIISDGPAIINVSGDITSGAGTQSYGIRSIGAVSITVGGNVTALGSPAIFSSSESAIIDVSGTVTASLTSNGINATGLTNRVRYLVDSPNGRKAIYAPGWVTVDDVQCTHTVYDDNLIASPVVLSNYVSDSPAPENVRSGIVYGPGSALAGACVIPATSAVAAGVAVDGTVGTGVILPADVWDYAATNLTGATAGGRLAATATVESTGDQVTALGGQ